MKNLIENPTLSQDAADWTILNSDDTVITDQQIEINRDKMAAGTVEFWSKPISMIRDCDYLLSFDVWVADATVLGHPDVAVIVRGFETDDKIKHADAKIRNYPSLRESGLKSGYWQTIKTVVHASVKYARVAIWFKTGHVKIKNIVFFELQSEEYFHRENNIIAYEAQYQLPKPAFLPLGQFNTRNAQEEYDLDFAVRVDDISGFFEQDSFFVVLESDHPFDLSNLNVVDFDGEAAQKLSINFENLTSNKWQRLTNTYRFDKPYVLYGAYLAGKGKVEIKNIKFAVYQSAPVQKINQNRSQRQEKEERYEIQRKKIRLPYRWCRTIWGDFCP